MLNIVPNLYIGSHELRRAFQAIKEDGYQKLFAAFVQSFGVAYTTISSLQVVQGNGGARFLTVKAGLAIDRDLNIISLGQDAVNTIEFPNVSGTMFLCIKHKIRKNEIGTINLSTDGSLTGIGTEFTKVLRGAPLNQVKIRVTDSSNNLDDYPVLEVIDDNHATLNSVSSITPESGKKFAVVGCFTPSISIPNDDKLIYSYDDFELVLTNANITPDVVFKLASVSWNGFSLSITDVRQENKLSLFDTTADLVQQITNTVINQYNLQITTQFAGQIATLNSQVANLIAADNNFASQFAALSALVATKANSDQEHWHYVGDSGEPFFNIKVTNQLSGNNRTKFKKTTTGEVFLHLHLKALDDLPFATVLFTLPIGYRPTTTVISSVVHWAGTGYPSSTYLQIDSAGQVMNMAQAAIPEDDSIQHQFVFQTTP